MMSKQFAGKFGDDSDSMDSYADDYRTTESAYISPYGTAVRRWNPRILSAKRDFPKAFDEVTTHAHSSVSKDELQSISAIGFGVPQLPKRRKVAVVRDFPIGMTGNYKEYVGPVESEEGSTDSGTSHLPYVDAQLVSDDLVPFEMDTVSSGSSINREMPGSDHEETDSDQLIKTGKRTIDLPYEGARVVSDDLVPFEMDTVSSGSSIKREMPGSDHEETDSDQLIKTGKGTIDLPYEGARVVSDDLVCESSGSSINREILSSDYEETDFYQLIKTRKGMIDLPYEGARVVSDDLVCESNGSSINRDILSSDYEDTDFDQLIKTRKGTVDLPYEGARVVSDDLVCESSGSSIKTELKIHGASVKDIRLNQSQGQIQIQLSIDNLQNYNISIKPSGKKSRIHKRAVKRMATNHTDTRKQLHSRKGVSVVRCFPPGCGPDATPFTDEELEGAIADSRRHMLLCKSCNSL